MNRKTKIALALALIFMLAAYVRIDFIRSVDHEMSPDAINYDAMTKQLLDKGVYGYNDSKPNAYVTPGYPLFLAGVYAIVDHNRNDPLPYVRYLQVLLSLIAVWLVYRITAMLSKDIAGLIAAFVAAIYPPLVWMNGAILTEGLGVFLLLSYLYTQIAAFQSHSRVWAAAAGVLLGLTVLTRPEFMPLIVVTYLFYWIWKKDTRTVLKLFGVTCVCFVLVMMPWWIRNAVTLNDLILTGTQSNPFTAGTYPYKNYEDGLVDRHGKTESEVGIERLVTGFTTQPWLFLKWYTVGKLDYIYGNVYAGGGYTPYYPVLPFMQPKWLHLGIVWLGVLAMLTIARKWRQPAMLLVVVIAVMTLIRLAFIPEYRYNITMMPPYIIICSVVGSQAVSWLYRKSGLQRKQATEVTSG